MPKNFHKPRFEQYLFYHIQIPKQYRFKPNWRKLRFGTFTFKFYLLIRVVSVYIEKCWNCCLEPSGSSPLTTDNLPPPQLNSYWCPLNGNKKIMLDYQSNQSAWEASKILFHSTQGIIVSNSKCQCSIPDAYHDNETQSRNQGTNSQQWPDMGICSI